MRHIFICCEYIFGLYVPFGGKVLEVELSKSAEEMFLTATCLFWYACWTVDTF